MKASGRSLRKRLNTSAPDLDAALTRSWYIAENEWLPALGAALDSFNSYPHLRNVEHYLDALTTNPPADEQEAVPMLRIELTPVEIYVLLTAALLHDVGRTKGEPHGYYSGELIENQYADLGIPSRELAQSIARVAAFHDKLEMAYIERQAGDWQYPAPEYRKVVDPHGPIRERILACLLRLADYLDSTLTRVMPVYLRSLDEIKVVGAFRRIVSGVEVDHEAKMICTVLGDIPTEAPAEDVFVFEGHEDCVWRNLALGLHERKRATQLARGVKKKLKSMKLLTLRTLEGQVLEVLSRHMRSRKRRSWDEEPGPREPKALASILECVPLVKEMIGTLAMEGEEPEKCRKFEAVDWLLARRAVKIKEKKRNKHVQTQAAPKREDAHRKWHPRRVLAIVLSDVLKNARALFSVRSDLSAVGIPLHAWLIAGHERLFNLWGEETFEPIFTRQYLKDVAAAMWELSVHVFGQSFFTYQNLADALRDPDVDRVRRAVRRIGIVMRPDDSKGDDDPSAPGREMGMTGTIWAGEDRWQWLCGNDCKNGAKGGGRSCDAVLLKEACEKIDILGRPA